MNALEGMTKASFNLWTPPNQFCLCVLIFQRKINLQTQNDIWACQLVFFILIILNFTFRNVTKVQIFSSFRFSLNRLFSSGMQKGDDPGKFRQLDEIMFINGYPGYQHLMSITENCMQVVCEIKGCLLSVLFWCKSQ